jgi:curved DNA-binding protein CbpA
LNLNKRGHMSRLPDYYAILGVHPLADEEVITAAYRALAKKYHPDAAGAGSAARFVEVQEAYEALRDPERRNAYDEARARADNTQGNKVDSDEASAEADEKEDVTASSSSRVSEPSGVYRSTVPMALVVGLLVITLTVLSVEMVQHDEPSSGIQETDAVGAATQLGKTSLFPTEDAKAETSALPSGNTTVAKQVPGEVSKQIQDRIVGDRFIEGGSVGEDYPDTNRDGKGHMLDFRTTEQSPPLPSL